MDKINVMVMDGFYIYFVAIEKKHKRYWYDEEIARLLELDKETYQGKMTTIGGRFNPDNEIIFSSRSLCEKACEWIKEQLNKKEEGSMINNILSPLEKELLKNEEEKFYKELYHKIHDLDNFLVNKVGRAGSKRVIKEIGRTFQGGHLYSQTYKTAARDQLAQRAVKKHIQKVKKLEAKGLL